MKPPETLDLDVFYEDEHYLNTVLSRHCLLSTNAFTALDDREVSSDRLTQDNSHFNERQDACNNLLHPLIRSSIAKSDGISAFHSYAKAGLAPNGTKREVSSTLQLLGQLNRLNGLLWINAEDLQQNASYNVHQFVHNVRGTMKSKALYDYNELAESLRSCESIVSSTTRKCDKTRSLQTLEQLECVIKLNIKAVSLIHNWDDTLRKLRSLFDKYDTFCCMPSEGRLSQLFQNDSEEFNNRHIIEIRNILLQLKESKGLYATDGPHFTNLEETLDEFISEYINILDDISDDIANKYFVPCTQPHEDTAELLSEELEEIIPHCLELYVDLFNSDESASMLLSSLSSSITAMFSLEFTNLWDEHRLMEYTDDIDISDADRIELVTSSLCDIMTQYIGIFSETINERLPLFILLFSKMDVRGFLKRPNERLSKFITEIFKSSLELFGVFEGVLCGVSDEIFLRSVTTLLSSLENIIDVELMTLEEVDIKDDMSQMEILPSGIFHQYVRTLFSWTEQNVIVCIPNDEGSSLKEIMSGFEEMIEYLATLKTDEKGFLVSTNEPIGYHGVSWVYNRFVLWQLKSSYEILMSKLFQHVNDHFVNLWQKNVAKDTTTEIEDECRDLLSSILDNNCRLMDIVRFNLIPNTDVLYNGNPLCNSIAHSIKEANGDVLYYLPEGLRSYVIEVDAMEATESFFSADCNLIDTAVSHIVEYIAGKASLLISDYYSKGYTGLSVISPDDELQESRTILLVGEYFTLLLSRFCDGNMLPLNIMGKAYTRFIDAELERLAQARPYDVASRRCYRADVEHLMLISNYCGADVADSLELLLEGC